MVMVRGCEDGQMIQQDNNPRILVFSDEPLTCKLISFILSEEGFDIYTVDNVQAALAVLAKREIALMLLDETSPSLMSSPEAARKLYAQCSAPTVVLRAKQDDDGDGAGLGVVEDYIIKPFSFTEFVARVRAILRRSRHLNGLADQIVLKVGGLELDVAALTVTLSNKKKVYLSPTEMKVLRCLMSKPGQVVSRESLMEAVWGVGFSEDNYIRVCISRVRSKLERSQGIKYIEAVRGSGYRLNLPGSSI